MRTIFRTSLIVRVGILAVTALGLRTAVADDPKPETLVESYARAQVALTNSDAAMLQAQASWITTVANVRKMAVETLKICEDVRSMGLDNQVKTTETHFGKRDRREQYLAKHPRVRPDLDTYRRICSGPKPVDLVSYQVARDGIRWPELLQQPEFGKCRQELEILFAARPRDRAEPSSWAQQLQFQHKVDNLTRQMRDQLKEKVHEVGQMEYVAAKRFITGLAYGARQDPLPSNSDKVAANN
jgi:hypothetical protein